MKGALTTELQRRLPAYLAQNEHVFALLVGDPVDGLLGLGGLVHPLQVLLQDLLMQRDLKGKATIVSSIVILLKNNLSLLSLFRPSHHS